MSIMNSVISAQSGGGGGVPTCSIRFHPPTPNEPTAYINSFIYTTYENGIIQTHESAIGDDDKTYDNIVCGSFFYLYLTGQVVNPGLIIPDSMEQIRDPYGTDKYLYYVIVPDSPGEYEVIYHQ